MRPDNRPRHSLFRDAIKPRVQDDDGAELDRLARLNLEMQNIREASAAQYLDALTEAQKQQPREPSRSDVVDKGF
jgi:hypothetical protein